MKEYLFVYGTLKRGRGNHRLLGNAKFIGEGETVEKYKMYDIGVPIVVKGSPHVRIKGELYMVDEKILKQCDSLEGHPDMYKREKIKVEVKGRQYWAWMYFWVKPVTSKVVIEDGEWR